jgi:hypothetical protein
MDIRNYKPQYVDLKFASSQEFDVWLEETTKYKVTFQDEGQDLIRFYIAENMEIIHTHINSLASIYNGAVVTNGVPQELAMLQIYNPKFDETQYIKYQIDRVITY